MQSDREFEADCRFENRRDFHGACLSESHFDGRAGAENDLRADLNGDPRHDSRRDSETGSERGSRRDSLTDFAGRLESRGDARRSADTGEPRIRGGPKPAPDSANS